MTNNQINTEIRNKNNVIYVANNNAKYYEQAALQHAANAEKSVSDCAAYVGVAQKILTECAKVRDEAELITNDVVELHANNLENPHEVTAAQVDSYTKSEVDVLLSNVEVDAYTKTEIDDKLANLNVNVDLSSYYTSSQVNTKLNTKANTNLEDTPFAESGLYITQTNNNTEWSRAFYSDVEKTNLVWLEQGGYNEYSNSVASDSSVTVSISLPIKYNNGYYTRVITPVTAGFLCSTDASSASDNGSTLNVCLTNKNTSASSPVGFWWQTSGHAIVSSSGGGFDTGGDTDPVPDRGNGRG
ncbi:MAG: hypothetical protein NC200_03575 [Candidatus Gastranaerophilales bacterium]|nr:hypothetical protein [Candidatus Gastranaerophilales bacterium]